MVNLVIKDLLNAVPIKEVQQKYNLSKDDVEGIMELIIDYWLFKH